MSTLFRVNRFLLNYLCVDLYYGAATEGGIVAVRTPAGGTVQDYIDLLNAVKDDAIANRPKYSQVTLTWMFAPADWPGEVIPSSLNTPITNMINADIPVIIAIGQFNTLEGPTWPTGYASYFPQRVGGALKVGYTHSNLQRVNHPSGAHAACTTSAYIRQIEGVDVFAPAGLEFSGFACYQIGPVMVNNFGAEVSESGSSFAAPQAAGVMAMFGSLQSTFHPKAWMMNDAVISTATSGIVTSKAPSDANRFLYSNFPTNQCRNSASYAEGIARGSFASCFGAYTGVQTEVYFRNSPATPVVEHPMLDVNGNIFQTNFRVPDAMALGPQIVKSYKSGSVFDAYGFAYLHDVAPGVFSLDYSGTGPGVIQAYYTDKVTGAALRSENVSAAGTNWNSATENLILVVYGTGWRYGSNPGIFLKSGGNTYPPGVTYSGPGGQDGLDQMNTGNIPIAADGKTLDFEVYQNGIKANVVTVKLN